MNVIGKFGNFMIIHQFELESALMIILVLAGALLLVLAVIHARKKRQLLSQIQETVSEIHTSVKQISEKKSDVIYIDNRTGDKEGDALKVLEKVTQAPEQTLEPASEKPEAPDEILQVVSSPEVPDIPRKYFSRDCGTSKTGKTYTVEELEEQIKE